jgi:membrane protein DedA with SNARE-associated domain
MPSWLDGSPFAITFAVLFGIVFLRAQGTYWIGRAVTAGLLHTRLARWMTRPRMTRAIDALNRWGLPAVTLSFLTVGFQTVVNVAAGLIRMRWVGYTLAMLIGCAAWAAIYATVGIAAVEASLALAARSPLALAAVLAVVLGLVIAVIAIRRRSRRPGRHRDTATELAPGSPSPQDAPAP